MDFTRALTYEKVKIARAEIPFIIQKLILEPIMENNETGPLLEGMLLVMDKDLTKAFHTKMRGRWPIINTLGPHDISAMSRDMQ